LSYRLKYSFCLIFILGVLSCHSQIDSLKNYKARKIGVGIGSAVLTTGSLLYLNQVWYSQYNSGKFHYFNDGKEWLQMDKAGHTASNFLISRYMMDIFEWAGFSKRKQMFIGGSLGFAYMTVVEVMDGYSTGWGFSWQDMGYNALGAGMAMGQKALWDEQRVNLKFSFHTTHLAQYNPELLGTRFSEQILKDYNGQTYWLSVSPFAFCKKESRLPKWLAISFGYGADGMIGARYNNKLIIDDEGFVTTFDRVRQYYISLDIDFSKIKTRSKILKAVFNSINLLKFPMPTMEFQSGGKTKFHYLYF
jgi:hypothetical protein